MIDELGRLPGIGPKSAQRIAFHILGADSDDVARLASALTRVVNEVTFCEVCCSVAEGSAAGSAAIRGASAPASGCRGAQGHHGRRTHPRIPGSLPRARGAISPIDGIGPNELNIRQLLTRLSDGEVTEVILATDPNLEGEATATYLARLLEPLGLTVSRLASGLPVGGDLEYADEVTLGRAFAGRRRISMEV